MTLASRLYAALYRFFLGAADPKPWLVGALVIGSLPYVQALAATFAGPFTIDDDARQFVFWMVRWRDPALFQNDLIASYFASVSPPGFHAAYWLPVQLGIDPVLASKLYPIALNGVMTVYAFRLGLLLSGGRLPAAFLGAVGFAFLMAWSHIIISGTPRAFGLAFLMVFLYQIARRRTVGMTIAGALVSLTYPPAAALGLGALGLTLLRWRKGLRLDFTRATVLPIVCAGSVSVGILLVAAIDRDFGPVAAMEQIRTQPMYRSGGGRLPLLDAKGSFRMSPCGGLVGVVPIEWCQFLERRPPAAVLLGLLLAGLIWAAGGISARGRPGERPVDWGPIFRLLIAGTILYGIAFALMLKLHMPARYAVTPLRLVGILGATMFGVLLAERALGRAGPVAGASLNPRQWAQLGLAALTVVAFAGLYPLAVSRRNVRPHHPAILAYLRGQPKSALIAGMHSLTSNVPAFAQRRVLIANEYAIPIDRGYIGRYRVRAQAMIDAQYTADPNRLIAFLRRYRISHLVVDPAELTADGLKSIWWQREYPNAHAQATAALARGASPILLRLIAPCRVIEEHAVSVLDARCVLERARGSGGR